jgi:hypothetical protein
MNLNHPAFYTGLKSTKLRTYSRVCFTLLFLILAGVAKKFCILLGKLRVLRRKRAKVSFFTRWLPASTAIEYWIRMRSIPAGWLGIVMILVMLLALLSDIAVAGLVMTTSVVGRCPFGAGVVIPSQPATWRPGPASQQKAFRMATGAFDTSLPILCTMQITKQLSNKKTLISTYVA